MGFDLVRSVNSPRQTLLGLRSLPIQTIIDVGANAGQFARYVSKFFPSARLYCFEPLSQPFQALDAWAKTQSDRVTTFNTALGEKEGTMEMFFHAEYSPSSSFLSSTATTAAYYPATRNQKRVPVKITTLDKIWETVDGTLSPQILIKLDVQGYEDRVIHGGKQTFINAKACILEVCLDTLYEGQATFKDLLLTLNDLGYRYVGNLSQTYGEGGHVIFLDAVFMQ
jgi:methyltransferase, FkbM family